MSKIENYVRCDHCGQGFTEAAYTNRHTPHEADCHAIDNAELDCDCDINLHERCVEAYKLKAACVSAIDFFSADFVEVGSDTDKLVKYLKGAITTKTRLES